MKAGTTILYVTLPLLVGVNVLGHYLWNWPFNSTGLLIVWAVGLILKELGK